MSLRSIPSLADARENRNRVLNVARGLLAERGLSAEINDIAPRDGVGGGTIYRNYESKEAVISEIARLTTDFLLAGLIDPSSAPPAD